MNLKRWLREHSLKLLAIRDTPEAIAGGIAIGIFFGFTPLFGLKTLLAIFFAWLTRSNIIAAVLAGTLHDLILPLMPFVLIGEYKIGYWLMNQEWPHVSMEAVIARAPQALLMMRGGTITAEILRTRPGWDALPARSSACKTLRHRLPTACPVRWDFPCRPRCSPRSRSRCN